MLTIEEEPKIEYAQVAGQIVERLKLGNKEWLTIKFANGQMITIDKNLCQEIDK